MIVSSCPLRISLVGGGTDHPLFLEKYGKGKVISFPSPLRVYASMHRDVDGLNMREQKFIINYSKREEVSSIDEIQNELVREVLKYYKNNIPLYLSLTSDISSTGSGLASSSAYCLAMCKILSNNLGFSDNDLCKVAMTIERKINPFVGQQDFYGSVSGGVKKIEFFNGNTPKFTYFDDLRPKIFYRFGMALIPTNIRRASTNILEKSKIDLSKELLNQVDCLETAIHNNDEYSFYSIIKDSWAIKKSTSDLVLGNDELKAMDDELSNCDYIKAHKLCGAGNGGYFLVFYDKNRSGERNLLNRLALPSNFVHTEGLRLAHV